MIWSQARPGETLRSAPAGDRGGRKLKNASGRDLAGGLASQLEYPD